MLFKSNANTACSKKGKKKEFKVFTREYTNNQLNELILQQKEKININSKIDRKLLIKQNDDSVMHCIA